ncbi:hypothetical protein ACFYO2_47420 [Streptomyces sp. NPDC006602]|uniref:hypothetical protein n=1 Tax=Streptomyces sp. NPDC006602 TaxID=3364751 RepID=UPI0036815B9F
MRRLIETHDQPARISPEIRRLLLRLASARQGCGIANTRALLKECDDLLGRRTPAPAALKQARDSAEQRLLERSNEVVTQGPKGGIVVLTGHAAKQEREKRERKAQQAAFQQQEYLVELVLALEQERVALYEIAQGGSPNINARSMGEAIKVVPAYRPHSGKTSRRPLAQDQYLWEARRVTQGGRRPVW